MPIQSSWMAHGLGQRSKQSVSLLIKSKKRGLCEPQLPSQRAEGPGRLQAARWPPPGSVEHRGPRAIAS